MDRRKPSTILTEMLLGACAARVAHAVPTRPVSIWLPWLPKPHACKELPSQCLAPRGSRLSGCLDTILGSPRSLSGFLPGHVILQTQQAALKPDLALPSSVVCLDQELVLLCKTASLISQSLLRATWSKRSDGENEGGLGRLVNLSIDPQLVNCFGRIPLGLPVERSVLLGVDFEVSKAHTSRVLFPLPMFVDLDVNFQLLLLHHANCIVPHCDDGGLTL